MRDRRARGLLALLLVAALAIPLVALAVSRSEGGSADETPSFTRDVAPIVAGKCAGCHRVDGIAPFPLQTPRQISSRTALIAAAVDDGRMPPWPPGPDSPGFVGERGRMLSNGQRRAILAWARAGGPVDGPARATAAPVRAVPLKKGEKVLELRMPVAYRPRAAGGTTDDYRCFLLDPKLAAKASVTSARIEPGRPKLVHHVILFRVPREQVGEATRLDAGDAGPGWSCFGGTGISIGAASAVRELDDASWVAAWAPGGLGGRVPDGTGIPLRAGSRIVMQVHYNLLNGRGQDRSRAVLTVAPASAGLLPLRTMLLPGPVELSCAEREKSSLCERSAALGALARKYGPAAAFTPTGLLLLCGRSPSSPQASALSTCDRRLSAPGTIHVVAGHMHLLGAAIRVLLNPGTPRERVLLDIPRWDFHWQGAYTLARPVRARAGDVVRVTCRHDVGKRVRGEDGIPTAPRYVLWGEGTTDEMCLGILQITRT